MGGRYNRQKALAPLDTTGTTSANEPAVNGGASEVVGLGDMEDHIQKLKQVSATTKNLMNLLGGQLQELSATIPVLRGFDIAKELGELLKERQDGLAHAFDPLRAHIENQKILFCARNAKPIERMIQKRVEEGVKRKFPVVLKERLGQYKQYLETNSAFTSKIKQEMATMSARTANSILHPNYPDAQVTLILPRPEWNALTFWNLKNIGGPAAAKLARDQGLTPIDHPDSERARVHNLNMILRYLGLMYKAVSSKNGLLLVSVPRQISH